MSNLRLATHNVNGIRASLKRGFGEFWAADGADVICLQEVRCRVADLPEGAFGDYHVVLEPGQLAGRNGVAILTRQPVTSIRTLSGHAFQAVPGGGLAQVEAEPIVNRDLAPFAEEGRYLEVELADAPLRVASLYLPKGAAWPYEEGSKEKYDRKMRFLQGFARQLVTSRKAAAAQGREFVVVGDFNIAHTKADLKNWRSNQRSEGFLPEERDWFSSILSPRQLVDVVRGLHPETEGPYSWWSWRGQSFVKDVGWRIDYQLSSPGLAKAAVSASVAKEASYEARMSDHSPVIVDYDLARLTA